MVGYGGSIEAGRGRDIPVAQQSDYPGCWMRELDLEEAILVGHDLGGGVVQILAVEHPELVRGLILTNAVCYDSWPISQVKLLWGAAPVVERFPDEVFCFVYESFMLQGHADRWSADEPVSVHFPFYERGDGAAAFVRQVRSLDVRDTLALADRIPELRLPARIVWGAADQFQKIGYGYRLAYELGAPMDRVEGGKHFTPEDHPGPIAAAVNELPAKVG